MKKKKKKKYAPVAVGIPSLDALFEAYEAKRKAKNRRSNPFQPKSKVKSECCFKYRKGEHKRCKRCPCFDLAS